MFSALRTNIAVFFTGRVLETIIFSTKRRIGSILCDELQAMRLVVTIAFAVGTLSKQHDSLSVFPSFREQFAAK